MNCLEFVIILLPVPKVNKLSVPIFLKKKEFLPPMGGTKNFSTEEKCYLMGWGEYGVKSKDIVPVLRIRIWIRIHRIHMFLGLQDPDPDPSIIMQKY